MTNQADDKRIEDLDRRVRRIEVLLGVMSLAAVVIVWWLM